MDPIALLQMATLRQLCVAAQEGDVEGAEKYFRVLDKWIQSRRLESVFTHKFQLHRGAVECIVYAGEEDSRRPFHLSHHDLLEVARTGMIAGRLELATT